MSEWAGAICKRSLRRMKGLGLGFDFDYRDHVGGCYYDDVYEYY